MTTEGENNNKRQSVECIRYIKGENSLDDDKTGEHPSNEM